jgi:hypothetical protein
MAVGGVCHSGLVLNAISSFSSGNVPNSEDWFVTGNYSSAQLGYEKLSPNITGADNKL